MLKHQFVKSVQINYVLLQTLTWQWTAMSIHQQAAVIRPIQTDFGFRSHSSEHKPWNFQKPTKHRKCSLLSAASMSLKQKKLGLAVRKLRQHCKCYKNKEKNGTDICWKQILNNQNCCKSIFFPRRHLNMNNRDDLGGGGVEIYEELAYNRTRYARTHETTRPSSSLTTWKPASASLRWLHILRGWKYKLHMIRLFCLNTPTVSHSNPSPPITD